MAGQDKIRDLIGRGEYLLACDAARELMEQGHRDLEIRYLYVLSLARSGAGVRAAEQFSELGLDRVESHLDTPLELDVVALGARLAKDRAIVGPTVDAELAAASARSYELLYTSSGSTYPGVNAATMWLAAGDEARARELAHSVLNRTPSHESAEPLAGYWAAATEAEAALVLGDTERVGDALDRAVSSTPIDLAARASTFRQLQMVCTFNGIDTSVIDVLRNRMVVHFCGHRMSAVGSPGRFNADQEQSVTTAVRKVVADLDPLAGYGSLASGADTIVAEALLDAGAELHLWLPFDREEFISTSVAPAGANWVERFERCERLSTTVENAVTGDSLSDPTLFDYCSRLAMGDALIRARFLSSPVHQIAVWDGQSTDEVAGTAIDVHRWAGSGHAATVVSVSATAQGRASGRVDEPTSTAESGAADSGSAKPVRVIRALVFADVAGFGRLGDRQVATFDREVLTNVAETVDTYGAHVLLRETWGDGIYLVFDDVTSAAGCALDMQAAFAAVDLDRLGLASLRGLRIGAHVGPVLQGWDPVAQRPRFSGSHVTHAARIEPRTPEGAVYVTRQFAAAVELDAAGAFACEYVGRVPAAKKHGIVPMYVLTRSG